MMAAGEVSDGRLLPPLFQCSRGRGRAVYRLLAGSIVLSFFSIWSYRVLHLPPSGDRRRMLWSILFAAELWSGCYWLMMLVSLWDSLHFTTFKDRLSQRFGDSRLPMVDIFVCTADPNIEPPIMVANTVLSLMALDHPTEKLCVYLSDDAGSKSTFHTMVEVARFAKFWIPFCRKHKVEPTSPAAYLSCISDPSDQEVDSIRRLYKEMENRIEDAITSGRIPDDFVCQHKGYSEWNSKMTSSDHHAIVQVVIDREDPIWQDIQGLPLPTLVYVAREKRPNYHHNFKAGAINALLRVSSLLSNSPIILQMDCDMYLNNSSALRDALCFFMDETGRDVGFVQFPQCFRNLTKNSLYGDALLVANKFRIPCMNPHGGPCFMGTGCFHRRESICGGKYGIDNTLLDEEVVSGEKSIATLEAKAKALIACLAEEGTEWGNELGLKYGCIVEDLVTGISIQSNGWRSVFFDPEREAFLGLSPITLSSLFVQHRRWSDGMFRLLTSKYNPLIYGFGKIKIQLQMSYLSFLLSLVSVWATLCIILVPSLSLLSGIDVFPRISSLWIMPFCTLFMISNFISLLESLWSGQTFKGWLSLQRVWIITAVPCLLGIMDSILSQLGITNSMFIVTPKYAGPDVLNRYCKELMEFGPPSFMFTLVALVSVLQLFSLSSGIVRVAVGGVDMIQILLMQLMLCAILVFISIPIYHAMFFRKDRGRMPTLMTVQALVLAAAAATACILYT